MIDEHIEVNRFTSAGQDLAIDWTSVVAIQKIALNINIYLKAGNTLNITAPDDKWCKDYFETLYAQWEHSIEIP